MLRSFIVAVVLAVSVSMVPIRVSAQGQQPANALATCLADSTSGKDRKDLAKWIFFAIAAHPEIRQHASANTAAAADESSRTMATLVVRLLTESCVNETKTAISSGQGSQTLQLAFSALGQLAMQELMTDKSVQSSMALFERYLDKKRLTDALAIK